MDKLILLINGITLIAIGVAWSRKDILNFIVKTILIIIGIFNLLFWLR